MKENNQLELFPVIVPDIGNAETLHCRKCDQHKPLRCFNDCAVEYETKERPVASRGVSGSSRWCKECIREYRYGKEKAEKSAPPRPNKAEPCDCCGKLTEPTKFHLDHNHVTHEFRGWLCRPCNVGLGQLGDTIEGLEKAIRYLERTDGR